MFTISSPSFPHGPRARPAPVRGPLARGLLLELPCHPLLRGGRASLAHAPQPLRRVRVVESSSSTRGTCALAEARRRLLRALPPLALSPLARHGLPGASVCATWTRACCRGRWNRQTGGLYRQYERRSAW